MDCGDEITPGRSFHSTEQKWLSVALQMALIDVNALEPLLMGSKDPSTCSNLVKNFRLTYGSTPKLEHLLTLCGDSMGQRTARTILSEFKEQFLSIAQKEDKTVSLEPHTYGRPPSKHPMTAMSSAR